MMGMLKPSGLRDHCFGRGIPNNCLFIANSNLGKHNRESKTASGNSSIGIFCFPVQPPVPSGFGTRCEPPTGSANVFVTRVE